MKKIYSHSVDELSTLLPGKMVEKIKSLLENFVEGRYEFEGGAYLNAESYDTKLESRFEAHRKMIDIQIIVSGTEMIHLAPILQKFETLQPYDEKRDIEFMKGTVQDTVLLHAGEFAIIGPDAAHMPCMAVNGSTKVEKIVVKIPVTE